MIFYQQDSEARLFDYDLEYFESVESCQNSPVEPIGWVHRLVPHHLKEEKAGKLKERENSYDEFVSIGEKVSELHGPWKETSSQNTYNSGVFRVTDHLFLAFWLCFIRNTSTFDIPKWRHHENASNIGEET
jgi:hypothetical protein